MWAWLRLVVIGSLGVSAAASFLIGTWSPTRRAAVAWLAYPLVLALLGIGVVAGNFIAQLFWEYVATP
jgi:hypothetical protein